LVSWSFGMTSPYCEVLTFASTVRTMVCGMRHQ
jgi:hypothetical protein